VRFLLLLQVALERCVQRLRHRLAAESAAAAQEAFRLREAALDQEAARLHAHAQARALALAQDSNTATAANANNHQSNDTAQLPPTSLIPPPAPFPSTPVPAASAAASANMGTSGSCGGQETWGPAAQPVQEAPDVRGNNFAQATTAYQNGQAMGRGPNGPSESPSSVPSASSTTPTGLPGSRATPGELARVALTLQAGFSVADRRASDAMPSFGFGLDDDDNEGDADNNDDDYGVGLDVNDASDDEDETAAASLDASVDGARSLRGRGRSASDLGIQGVGDASSLLPPFKNSRAAKPRSRSNSADSADASDFGLWYRGATTDTGGSDGSRGGRADSRAAAARGRNSDKDDNDDDDDATPPPRGQAEERIAASTGQMASFYYQRRRRSSAQSPRSRSVTRLSSNRGTSNTGGSNPARGRGADEDADEATASWQRAANARTWGPGDIGNSTAADSHPPLSAAMFEEPHEL